MDKRPYNIFFHLHTVTGIVISVLLYVIFFAGSFSFFRSDIIAWERNEPVTQHRQFNFDVDAALDTLATRYNLSGRDISFYKHGPDKRVAVNLSAPKDTLVGKEGAFFYMHPGTFRAYDYDKSYSLGEFLYRLHFFAQIPYPAGYYLSGFTALFFLFAVFTGIVIHWKKIVSNFYLFRPREKLKTVWTDAHTALGTIGLPFQVVYAVTGAFFMINIVLVIPSVALLYDGDQGKLYTDLGYTSPVYTFENKRMDSYPAINTFITRADSLWTGFEIDEVSIYNYGDRGMHVTVAGELDHTIKFTALGQVTFKAATSEMVSRTEPTKATSYLEGVKSILYHLHFGDYGGYAVKGISFMLGLATCFVIITGILIWLEARNKKNVPENEKRFNERVGNIYLAICLTMYPVTAAAFILTRVLPAEFDEARLTILYSTYFGSWLAVSIAFSWIKDNFLTNKWTLISGGILGLAIPLVNGISTGNWFWLAVRNNQPDIFIVDVLWILVSIAAFYTVSRLRRAAVPVESTVVSQKQMPVKRRVVVH